MTIALLQVTDRAVCHRLRPRLHQVLLLLLPQRSDQIDTLLYGTDGCYLMVHFHGLQGLGPGRVLARLIYNRLIEEFPFVLIDLIVSTTGHDLEIIRPTICQPYVLLRADSGRSLRLAALF